MKPLDDFLPVYEFSERHSLAIDAPAARIDAAFRALSISDIPLARVLWWLRRLGRRLLLLDAVLVTTAIGIALGWVFGPSYKAISITSEVANVRPSSYLVLGPALALAWVLFLLITRT